MKGTFPFLAAAMALVFAGVARGEHSFAYGHVFVSATAGEGCFSSPVGAEAIVAIDPTIGAMSVFADNDDGLCFVSGLRFTPDGQSLLALNAGHLSPTENGWVQAFNPDGSSKILFDESDGLWRPYGANALAFDAAGNLYVLNSNASTILRFPAAGGGKPAARVDRRRGKRDVELHNAQVVSDTLRIVQPQVDGQAFAAEVRPGPVRHQLKHSPGLGSQREHQSAKKNKTTPMHQPNSLQNWKLPNPSPMSCAVYLVLVAFGRLFLTRRRPDRSTNVSHKGVFGRYDKLPRS